MATDFSAANQVLRQGAIEYGNRNYDAEHHLVLREDFGELDVCQHSLEYAAALLDAGQNVERANAVIAAVLTYQDLDPDSPTFGNFRWWHGETKVRDRNAVAFMSPWLARLSMENNEQLTADNRRGLREAMERCIRGVRAHGSGPDYTNIWLLKAASMVMLGRPLDQPELEADGAKRLDQWIAYTADSGLSEYNSPCYNAVNVFALEWIYHYAANAELRQTAAALLDYLYADIFQQWHWKGGIGGGTHSRAYDRDRDTGRSLVSCLVFKQCGQPVRQELRPFTYVFGVNDYPVPPRIRSLARKEGLYPLGMRYRLLNGAKAVECSLHMTAEFSLGTQSGRRPVFDDRALWDIPFKITYAGVSTERRSSYIEPAPTTHHATVASLQHGPMAIVLYEVDMKGDALKRGFMRLNIGPDVGGMIDEIRVSGENYSGGDLRLAAGTVLGWRVGETLVAIRLLKAMKAAPDARVPADYRLSLVSGVGLCLDCVLVSADAAVPPTDDLNCGYIVHCATVHDVGSLEKMLKTFAEARVEDAESADGRTVVYAGPGGQMRLDWDAHANRVTSRHINRQPVNLSLRYDSPLIRLVDEARPAVLGEHGEQNGVQQ